ncbi:archaetidylserine decarboxylase [Candidatus Kinetoplastidibacterium crithidiae]|uniref:Phosphatidylserine decarboxylase proenzyme n=1 Tax=Candidatus Kinetoplastidibacterium crithidiae TCC036E TaxID=1208918 RepID=M1L4L1_9PROT|nr:archaetidylserine decarboxylase [Candidatus Kinetoplastibacterium crithidii]AFZ82710.1 phosphatidylserine decarboxylase [Candidatus Kinetoplastibacterium crithidii (ex Angomonas deanei ATCC 30255)]AGF47638.1 phosphatidylserine decarboxylase [Candidatus Kinetoplastibacterium crithidii TCC036E]
MRIKDIFLLIGQFLLPHHLISKFFFFAANCRVVWLKNLMILSFIKKYDIDLTYCDIKKYDDYTCFNDFFTRSIKTQNRLLNKKNNISSILSPADGFISQFGRIYNNSIIQAKNHKYSVASLLGNDSLDYIKFSDGNFINIYLSPKNYHRVHMPFDATLTKIKYIPGKLFSVNPTVVKYVPNLFARNERVICLFDSINGPIAIVLVGSMIVSSIETVWTGLVKPKSLLSKPFTFHRQDLIKPLTLNKGDEMARFQLGSTVIVLFGSNENIRWDYSLSEQSEILFGQEIGNFIF